MRLSCFFFQHNFRGVSPAKSQCLRKQKSLKALTLHALSTTNKQRNKLLLCTYLEKLQNVKKKKFANFIPCSCPNFFTNVDIMYKILKIIKILKEFLQISEYKPRLSKI